MSPNSKPLPTSAGHLVITPNDYSRRLFEKTIDGFDCKSMANLKLLGPRSSTAWAGRKGERKHTFPSRRQSL